MARIERDRKVTSPSLPRAYPLVPRARRGVVIEDVDGNRFLDFNAGIAVTSTGHAHPEVVAAIQEQAASLIHYSASDFYLPDLHRRLRAAGPDRADLGAEHARSSPTRGPRRSKARSSWRGTRPGGSTSSRSSSRSTAARTGACRSPRARRSTARGSGRCCPACTTRRSATSSTSSRCCSSGSCRRTRSPRSSSSRSWARAATCSRPDGWFPWLRELCDRTASCSSPTRCRAAWAAPERGGRSSTSGVEPDILLSGKGIASGMPLGAFIAREDLMGWDSGAHGSTYGGQPAWRARPRSRRSG